MIGFSSLLGDLRIGVRMMWRQRALSATIITPVALAIATTTALFSIVDGLLYRPLPLVGAERLVTIAWREVDGALPPLAYQPGLEPQRAQLFDRLDTSPLLERSAISGQTDFLIADAFTLHALQLRVLGVSVGFFQTVGQQLAHGREFTAEDQAVVWGPRANVPIVPVVLGDDVWRRIFGGRSDLLNQVVDLAGRRVQIVGIASPDSRFPGGTNLWTPLASSPRKPTYARIADGATLAQLERAFPEFEWVALRDAIRPGGTASLVFLLSASGLLLLVSWVQVAALIFVGAVGRLPELGVRLAVGASRARLVRQFAVESALLAGSALLVAWWLAPLLTTAIVHVLPAGLVRGQYIDPDLRAFVFASLMSLVGLCLLCVLPAHLVRRADPVSLFRHVVGRTSALRVRHTLVVFQVCLTAVLLYVCGLAVHSFVRTATLDYGFDAENVLIFQPLLAPKPGTGRDQSEVEFDLLQRRMRHSVDALKQVPGVVAAATLTAPPFFGESTLTGGRFYGGVRSTFAIKAINGRPVTPIPVRTPEVGPDFVEALGATMVAGRPLSDPEFAGSPDVALITESLANRISPNLPAIGLSIQTQYFNGRVVGVIKDLINVRPGIAPEFELIYPAAAKGAAVVILVRTQGRAEQAQPAIAATLERDWGRLAPGRLRPLEDDRRDVLTPWRGRSIVLSMIAGLCLPLAAVGIGGAMAFSVRSRTREIAIRQALGAGADDVQRDVVRQSVRLVVFGLVAGILIGIATGRAMANQFFGVGIVDLSSVVGVSLVLIGVAWLAARLPARQAARIQPSAALRDN